MAPDTLQDKPRRLPTANARDDVIGCCRIRSVGARRRLRRSGSGAVAACGRRRSLSRIEIMPGSARSPPVVTIQRRRSAIALEAVGVCRPFDMILCYDVLEHLVDPGSLLKRSTGIAAPAARLPISVPNVRTVARSATSSSRARSRCTEHGHRDGATFARSRDSRHRSACQRQRLAIAADDTFAADCYPAIAGRCTAIAIGSTPRVLTLNGSRIASLQAPR